MPKGINRNLAFFTTSTSFAKATFSLTTTEEQSALAPSVTNQIRYEPRFHSSKCWSQFCLLLHWLARQLHKHNACMGRRNRLRELNTASDRLEVREQRVRSVRRHAKISGPQPQHHGVCRRWNDNRYGARYWFPCNVAARTSASKPPRRIEASAALGPAGSPEPMRPQNFFSTS